MRGVCPMSGRYSGPARIGDSFARAIETSPYTIHVERDGNVATFWIDPVRRQASGGFAPAELRRIQRRSQAHQPSFNDLLTVSPGELCRTIVNIGVRQATADFLVDFQQYPGPYIGQRFCCRLFIRLIVMQIIDCQHGAPLSYTDRLVRRLNC